MHSVYKNRVSKLKIVQLNQLNDEILKAIKLDGKDLNAFYGNLHLQVKVFTLDQVETLLTTPFTYVYT